MLKGLPADIVQEASDALGEDVRLLDSAQALESTRAVQLCLLIAGVAHARRLACTPDYVAGLSIGAYPAAVIAGSLDFADAIKLVSLRGELMQQAYPQGYGMTALIGPDLSSVEALLADIHSPQMPVYLANINADNQTVIAGSNEAMKRVAERIKGNGVAKRLAVSVPSHCPLLEQPAQALLQAFVPLKAPRITYLSSTRARLSTTPNTCVTTWPSICAASSIGAARCKAPTSAVCACKSNCLRARCSPVCHAVFLNKPR